VLCWCVTSKHYSHNVRSTMSDLILPAYGELVVVRYTGNERWYRATVLERDDENNIKVGVIFVFNFCLKCFVSDNY